MPVDSTRAFSPADRHAPVPGDVVGGRFVVEGAASRDAIGTVLRARDQKTGKPIALRVLAPGLLNGEDATLTLRRECKTAALLAHRNIIGTYGVGTTSRDAHFIACEWVDGVPLTRLVETRKRAGKLMSLRGAYNVLGHACKALSHAHGKTVHGALRPSIVWVSTAGRVKVGDFGVALAVARLRGAAALGADEQACLAPEVKAGGMPDMSADIFGLGALLYQMLTGKSPGEGFVPPSRAHPDGTVAIDTMLLKCLAMNPRDRFASADEVQRALSALAAEAPTAVVNDDLAVEIDVSLSSRPPPPLTASGAPSRTPSVGARVSIHESFRPPQAHGAAPPRVSVEVDLKSLLAKITENDAPRWMIVKNNLDHGPFSGRELVELILKGEIVDGHGLLNMDSGERKPIEQVPEFAEFLEQHKIKRRAETEKAALARKDTVEKASNVFKIVAVAAGIIVLGVLAGGYVLARQWEDEDRSSNDRLADLYERGEVDVSGSAGVLPDPPRRRGGRRTGSSGPAGAAGNSSSYDDAMNQAMELGDVTQGGSERRLTPADVAGVMNRHINSFFGCVSRELGSGGQLGNVQIDLAIAGSGQVLGASSRQGSAAFRSCIEARARQVRFPTFPAPRMGARFSFNVN